MVFAAHLQVMTTAKRRGLTAVGSLNMQFIRPRRYLLIIIPALNIMTAVARKSLSLTLNLEISFSGDQTLKSATNMSLSLLAMDKWLKLKSMEFHLVLILFAAAMLLMLFASKCQYIILYQIHPSARYLNRIKCAINNTNVCKVQMKTKLSQQMYL
jgi:hypothetical protein